MHQRSLRSYHPAPHFLSVFQHSLIWVDENEKLVCNQPTLWLPRHLFYRTEADAGSLDYYFTASSKKASLMSTTFQQHPVCL